MAHADKCQKCGKEDSDLRELLMACGYDMSELNLPMGVKTILRLHGNAETKQMTFYKMTVCKECRADWMLAIQKWFDLPCLPRTVNPSTGVFIREFGATREVSENEWYEKHPKREPFRIIPERG